MMSATAIFSLAATPNLSALSSAARVVRQVSSRILSSLPMTRSTSAMDANISAWVCAAQPVTTIRTSGRSRFSRRIDCRACATASLVTAQLLMTMVSVSPARSASTRTTSDSKALRRQPKVTTSTLMILCGRRKQRRIEAAFIFECRRARHQHVIVALPPLDSEFTAGQRDLHRAIGALQPRRGHCRGARRRAAGLRQSRAAFPGTNPDVIAIDDMGQRDVGALRKDRVIFQERPETGKIVGIDVVDPKNRMWIAHAEHRRRVQHRRIDRADLQFDRPRVAKLFGKRN